VIPQSSRASDRSRNQRFRVVRGRVELPTFRFSGVADSQLSPAKQEGLAVRGCASLALAADVAVMVAVNTHIRDLAATPAVLACPRPGSPGVPPGVIAFPGHDGILAGV
jgi:hypothetical protein